MGYMKDLLITIYGGGEDAVEAAKKLAPAWIPVSERLPEIGVSVLCSSDDPPGEDRVWIGQREEYEWYFPGANEMGTPTHWMPLPEPPSQATSAEWISHHEPRNENRSTETGFGCLTDRDPYRPEPPAE